MDGLIHLVIEKIYCQILNGVVLHVSLSILRHQFFLKTYFISVFQKLTLGSHASIGVYQNAQGAYYLTQLFATF